MNYIKKLRKNLVKARSEPGKNSPANARKETSPKLPARSKQKTGRKTGQPPGQSAYRRQRL